MWSGPADALALETVELGVDLAGERQLGSGPLDHFEIVAPRLDPQVEARRLVQIDGRLAADRVDATQLAQVGELVRRVDGDRALSGPLDLGPQRVLARHPIADVLILRQRCDD